MCACFVEKIIIYYTNIWGQRSQIPTIEYKFHLDWKHWTCHYIRVKNQLSVDLYVRLENWNLYGNSFVNYQNFKFMTVYIHQLFYVQINIYWIVWPTIKDIFVHTKQEPITEFIVGISTFDNAHTRID